MKLCIAGKNNIAVDILEFSLRCFKKKDIYVVVNQNDLLKNSWQKSLGYYANLYGVQIATLEEVQELDELIFLSLEYDRILRPNKFRSSELFNIHFSLLPEFKGMFTSILPILHYKDYTGVTLHKIDNGIDTGAVISQIKVPIDNHLTSYELYCKLLIEGANLVRENLLLIIDGKYQLTAQSVRNSTYYSKYEINFDNLEIDFKQTAFQIFNFIRAFNFRIYQLPKFKGYDIYKSEMTNTSSLLSPGSIIEEDLEKAIISTIDFDILIYKDYYDLLCDCAKVDDYHKAESIIEYVDDIHVLDKNGWNPMIIAAYNGSFNMVKLLLRNGGNPNSSNLNGTTALMYAKNAYLKSKDNSLLKLLLENGADPKIKDIHGKTIYEYIKDEILDFSFLT